MIEYYLALKKNEIMSVEEKWKMDGAGDPHVKWITHTQKAKIACFLSYVESRPKNSKNEN
jgi:hypothetical protein